MGNFDLAVKAAMMLSHPQPPITSSSLLHFVLESANLKDGHPFYEYKIKRLLSDVALGMMPSKVWGGRLDATGGYLVVKEDGDVLCYHIYSRNEFESYLFANTKLETASSTRHGFGVVYKEGRQLYFKLNLQMRFL
ncbi:HpaII family restriction endonuclease [Limnohabitans sp.]|uniref:HpaII family restriction endonuclease n=1 Tax=Limnohabitans sp. TaxID=1907725 RepID=UPI00286F8439|nr:HpaII family restriction endonuclease [Limnohabitans sp.]